MKENANSKTFRHRETARALELWAIYNPRYSTNVDTYLALLQRKRDLRIKPLSKIPESVLKEYPDIPFLKLKNLGKAQAYLKKLNASEIRALIRRIEYVVEYDYAYRTVSNRIGEFEYQVKHHCVRRSGYGVDPNSITGSSKKGRNHRGRRNMGEEK